MRLNLLLMLLLFSNAGKSQSSYSGYLGKFPITLVMSHYSDGVSLAYYAYNNYDSPITINGSLKKGTLELFEKNKDGNNSAILIFEGFERKSLKFWHNWIWMKYKSQMNQICSMGVGGGVEGSIKCPDREMYFMVK